MNRITRITFLLSLISVLITVVCTPVKGRAATPSITSLSPTSGAVGASVTITGTNFGSTQGTSTVKFNGTTVTSITSWSTTSIVAKVPTGATTGNVVVTVSSLASNGVSFTVVSAPSITSLSPTSGAVSTSVTITGTNFGSTQGTSTVAFNGTTATSITSWSATSIVAKVPTGATTGNVVVHASGVNSNGVSFTVLATPSITSLSPTSGAVGASVTITGTNFGSTQGTSTVKFNGTTATSITSWSATSIVAVVPTGATTGNVVVTVSSVASNGVSFTVVSAPSITSLSPTSGAVSASVTITGTNFGSTQGTSTVAFNGTGATSITSWSATSIVAKVPTGATTGNVVVHASGVNSNGVSFTVLATPSITSLSPTSGAVGASVTITGTNFGSTQGSSTVKFNGTTASSITSWSATSIVAVVPTGATTGNVVVTVSSLASNGVSFTVVSAPSITSLSPTSGGIGASVTITGTNFGSTQGTSTVAFNGTTATSITSWSATSIVALVPAGATTGNVVVHASGVNSNGVSFTVLATPSITSLSPTSGAVGASVTITGTNFGSTQGTSTVKFNGTTVTSITSWSATSIVAVVPTGATTGNVVVTVSGLASNGVSFTVVSAPSITSLSPTSGAVGTSVTITGTNFSSTQGSSTVAFNGTTATSITSWSATSIVAKVPTGATTGNVVVHASGVNSNGVSFTVLATPSITSLSPTSGAVGASVTIAGTNFGSTQGSSTVKFNGTTATSITSWSATSIVAVVPTGATTGNVVVTVSGLASNGVSFTVVSAPSITSLSPTSGGIGASVTITGTNFGSTQSTSTVAFNGTPAAVSSWSAASIVAAVPAGATTGNVVVTVGGVPSNGSPFTVLPTAPTPTFSPSTGNFPYNRLSCPASVSISDPNPAATIYYTETVGTTGTTPTTSSTVYAGSPICVASNQVLESMAVVSGLANSPPAIAVYTVQDPTPTFSPVAGSYVGSQIITVSDNAPSAPIYCAINATPTTRSPMYTAPLTVSSSETVECIATDFSHLTSAVGSAPYTITTAPATPVISLPSGSYTSIQFVTISDSSLNATIYYTTDGTAPTTSSNVYSGALTVKTSETLEAIAGVSGFPSSSSVSATYTLPSAVASVTSLNVTSQGAPVTSITAGGVVKLTAAVQSSGAPVTSGTVNFCDATAAYCTDIHLFGTAQLTSAGTATLNLKPAIGSYSYKAIFAGTPLVSASSSAGAQLTVTGKYPTATTIVGTSGSAGNYTLNVQVTGLGNNTIASTGTVSILDASNSNALLGTASLSGGNPSFMLSNTSSPATGSFPESVEVGDFNGDGIADLAVINYSDATITILLGNGDGTFTQAQGSPIALTYFPQAIAVGDFNGDGKLDLAVATAEPAIAILLGNGDGTFTQAEGSPVTVGSSNEPVAVAAGDFNGDGKLDLAVQSCVPFTPCVVNVLLGNGDGTFIVANGSLTMPGDDGGPISIAVGDFNGDGKLDLVLDNYVLLGNGDATFTQASVIPISTDFGGVAVAVGDFNGDGHLDLAIAEVDSEGAGAVSVQLGNGDGTFTEANGSPFNAPYYASSIAVGDFNNDGKPDLALATYTIDHAAGYIDGFNGVSTLVGNGDGTFSWGATADMGLSPTVNQSLFQAVVSQYPQAVAVGDFFGDGASDLALALEGNNAVAILQNQAGMTATATIGGVAPVGIGSHNVDASYGGDTNYQASASSTTPLSTVVSPASGPFGTVITITGTGFGSVQGQSTLTVGGIPATITSWNDTQIQAQIPNGTGPGPQTVLLTVNGQSGQSATFTVTPTITGLSPASGPIGTNVTISGANLGTSGTVTFNEVYAQPTSWGSNAIVVPVPAGATSGPVVVTSAGLPSNNFAFTVSAAISEISPLSGTAGTVVTITGISFGPAQGTSTVTFNGTAATVSNWSDTSIAAVVPTGATTGPVVVTVGGVPSNGVTFTVQPAITSLSPTSGAVGTPVTITGTSFGASQGTSTVTFDGTAATVSNWSPTSITAVVPTGAMTGPVVVTLNGVSSNGITFTVQQAIASLSPTSGAVGTPVTITGTSFGVSQGTSTVTFNGTAATVSNWSNTSITAVVPPGATTGPVLVTVNGISSNGVTFTVQPAIASLSPTSGVVGTSVTITGTSFGPSQSTSTVTFNGTAATVSNWSGTSITAVVPSGATTGPVVVTVGGVSSSGVTFTVQPAITSLSPTSGTVGTSVTITGTSFGATQGTVTFNGTTATVSSWSATSIAAVVPSGATSGNVVVTVSGVASNGIAFTVQSITMTSSANPSSYGGSVTFTATFSFSGPMGSVTFKDGGTQIGTGTITGTTATYKTSKLAIGQHSITASWPGTSSYPALTSSPVLQNVLNTPAITAWPWPSSISYGQTLASSDLIGGSASVNGTFGWTSPSTIPPVGNQSESVTFTPSDTTDYSSVTGSVEIDVEPTGSSGSSSSVSYTYDSQGRLYQAIYTTPSGTITVTYSYDSAGNRTSVVTQ